MVEGLSRAALLHPLAFAAACLVIEDLVVRAVEFGGTFTLTGLDVEVLVRRALLFHTLTGTCCGIVSLSMSAAWPMGRTHA